MVVFVISLYFFSDDIKEENRQAKIKTVEMAKSSYPTISILLNEVEVNRLHGYSTNIDSRMNREAITPIDEDQSFKILINENDYEIRRVDYELHSIYDDRVIESDSIKALEEDEVRGHKLAKIRFNNELKQGQEYFIRITLVTNKSKKINFYSRIKRVDNSNYEAKLSFVENFRKATFNKDDSIVNYLERTDRSLDSISYVNINSSFDLVTWKDLQPKIVGDIIPTIKEISSEFATVVLKYIVSIDTQSGVEYYYVDEFYRIRYSTSRMYLLNYERTMKSIFGINQEDIAPGDIKLGVTDDTDIELFNNGDSTKFSFVFNKELWCFNRFDNSRVKVFSFRQNESDYIRDIYDDHDIKIINMDQDGNIDFLVYGYMNRGAYEGHVGIILYRFYNLDNRIEELTYIPTHVTYQFLKESIGDFSYLSEQEIFYFHLNDTIYSYDLLTKQVREIATDVNETRLAFIREEHYIVWEEKDDSDLSKRLVIYDLKTQNSKEIKAEGDTVVKLLGTIGKDFIYGIANSNDIIKTQEGNTLIPMFKIIISNSKGKTLKEYQESGYYITDIEVDSNIITVKRGTISKEGNGASIIPTKDDNILNNMDLGNNDIKITKKDSQIMVEEWYITSPLLSQNDRPYTYKETVNTVVTKDTTLRLEKEMGYPGKYIVYALGEVLGIYEDAGKAISIADENVGLVFDLNQHIVWERGFTKTSNQLDDRVKQGATTSKDSFKACVEALVKYKFNNATIDKAKNGYEILSEYYGNSYVNLTGASLDQALYFVSEDRPLIAKINPSSYVLIIAYNSSSIVIYNPLTGSVSTVNRELAQRQIEESGNVFVSYSEEF